jgi:hypothetical protein
VAPLHVTALITAVPREIVFFVASTLPAEALSCADRKLLTDAPDVLRGETVTSEYAVLTAFSVSNTIATVVTLYIASLAPAVNSDEPDGCSERLCRDTKTLVPLDRKPNWYVIGRLGSDQKDAAKKYGVDSSRPPSAGVVANLPGCGGPLVVTVMAAEDCAQVRPNDSVERIGSTFAGITRYTARAAAAGMDTLAAVRADCRSGVAVSALQRAVQPAWALILPANTTWSLVLTNESFCADVVNAMTGAAGL